MRGWGYTMTPEMYDTSYLNYPKIFEVLFALQLSAQNLIGQLRIGFASGLLHQLTHKESLKFIFTSSKGFYLSWVGCQKLINNRLDRPRITDHAQAPLVDDRLG